MKHLIPPVQIAYDVDVDVDAAAYDWCERVGAGPFFVLRHISLVDVRYRGLPGDFDHSSAYGQWGPIMLELVQDHTAGPSPVRDVVADCGTGLHHLAFLTDDVEREMARRGWPEALRDGTSTGQAFVFLDATSDLGHMIELYEPTPSLRSFYAMVAGAARGWDRRNPVRVLEGAS